MKRALVVALLLSAGSLFGQPGTETFDQILQSATDVVVADVLRGSVVKTGSQVAIKAELRVVRVIKGGLTPGGSVALAWRYQTTPPEPPVESGAIPEIRGLWCLRKTPAGGYEPLMVAATGFEPFGGYYFEVPPGSPSYEPGSALYGKTAAELAAAMEDLGARHASDLEKRGPLADTSELPEWVRTRARFDALAIALASLDQSAVGHVYRQLSRSDVPAVKMFGLRCRIGTGDTAAYCEMEQDLPRLARVYGASARPAGSDSPVYLGDPRAGHCLGRMALSEVALPQIEQIAAWALRRPEYIPYLIALLASPDAYIRDSAMTSLCQIDGRQHTVSEHCAYFDLGANAEIERSDVEYWKRWWSENRGQVAKGTPNLPADIGPPARFASVPPVEVVNTEMPIETRLAAVLHGAQLQADRAHDAPVAANGTAPMYDRLAAKLSGADLTIWREVSSAANAKLADNDQRTLDLKYAARIRGADPSAKHMREIGEQRATILKAALDELKGRFSPNGWNALLETLPPARMSIFVHGSLPASK